MDGDSCGKDDDDLTINAAPEPGSEPVQQSLFEVVTIEEGCQPIYRPTRGFDLEDVP
jgi:hypothetical protein